MRKRAGKIIETRPFERDDHETEIMVEFSYVPGTPPSGMFGPPENYDPGDGPEIDFISVTADDGAAVTLTGAEEERIMDEIVQNPPEPDEPDYYTERKDERATGARHND